MVASIHVWLVVYLPLWKIWKSIGIIIPNISKNTKWSKPPTSCLRSITFMRWYLFLLAVWNVDILEASCDSIISGFSIDTLFSDMKWFRNLEAFRRGCLSAHIKACNFTICLDSLHVQHFPFVKSSQNPTSNKSIWVN